MRYLVWLTVVMALAGCSDLFEVKGANSLDLGGDVTVEDQHGAVARCAWSFRRRVVSCPGSLLPDKAPDTAADDISNPPTPARGD